MSERGAESPSSTQPQHGPARAQEDPHHSLGRKAATGESLRLYVAETEPSGIEKRKIVRWLLLALAAFLLHLFFFWVMPRFAPTVPSPPVEVTQIDPAKLQAVKNRWKERGFLLSKDEKTPKTKTPEPKNARYESDRNRVVERETRARQTNVIPNQPGSPEAKGKAEAKAQKAQNARPKVDPLKGISLGQLSNFRQLPPPGPTAEERADSQRRGRPGPTGNQALNDPTLPEGAENMLNTVESVYYSFYARIFETIGPLWQSRVRDVVYGMRLHQGNYTTRAEVIFDADGNHVETIIHESAGYSQLDQAVISSWQRIPRFPNPPRGLIQSDGKIHMGWSFTVMIDRDLNWNYVPPDRTN